MSWRSQFSCFLGRCLHIFPKTTLRFGTWNCASWRALRENLGLDALPAMPPARLLASPARWCSSLRETHNPMRSLLLRRAARSTVLWLDQDSWECCCPHASYVGNYAGDFKHLQLALWLTLWLDLNVFYGFTWGLCQYLLTSTGIFALTESTECISIQLYLIPGLFSQGGGQ